MKLTRAVRKNQTNLTGKPVVNVPINKKGVDYIVGDMKGDYEY